MLKFFLGFLLAMSLLLVPDFVMMYGDYVKRQYQMSECTDKGVSPDQCYFNMYFDKYKDNNPKLVDWVYYFQLGQGPLYWVLTKRCSNQPFHNPSAVGDMSGKITMRSYFGGQCSAFMMDLSDLIYGDGDDT